MGVLECSRVGCKNVMCNRYSSTYGYLCYECFEELVSLGPETNIYVFLRSNKQPNREEVARAKFRIEFPERNT